MSAIAVVCEDCLGIMRNMGDKSVNILTDPPYGIDHIHAGGRSANNGWNEELYIGDWDKERPSKEYFDEILRIGKTIVIWGGNYFSDYLPASMRWLVWDKGQRDFSLADCEFAWTNQDKASRIFLYPRSKALQEGKLHPTQKPLDLIFWTLNVCKFDFDLPLFDPYCGSGTVGVAAARTGRYAILIDKDPQYHAIAERRIRQAQAQPSLFQEG